MPTFRRSAGLNTEVAGAVIQVVVPDMSDPSVVEDAKNAKTELDALPPGEGPDDDTAGQLDDMFDEALPGLPPGGTFRDDDGNIHESFIEAIAAAGITRGCNPPVNDRYCPASTVTRGQMAAFLVRALKLPAASQDYFDDDGASIFQDDINRLADAGITRGCNPPANDRFCPNSKVSRGQMAAFLVRAFGYTDDGGGDRFVDDDGSIFEGDIDRLGTAGVTRGCNPPVNDRYCPDSNVRRDQMASFLSRALGLDPIPPP